MDIVNSTDPTNKPYCMEKVKLEDAAKELGVSLATLRSLLKHRVIPIGIADIQDGKQKWKYVVYREWLDKYKENMNVPIKAE